MLFYDNSSNCDQLLKYQAANLGSVYVQLLIAEKYYNLTYRPRLLRDLNLLLDFKLFGTGTD